MCSFRVLMEIKLLLIELWPFKSISFWAAFTNTGHGVCVINFSKSFDGSFSNLAHILWT